MTKETNPMPDLAQPRFGITETNPKGAGLFFAVMRTGLQKCDWKRGDFEKVQFAEGLLNALEAHVDALVPVPATEAPAPVVTPNVADPVAVPPIENPAPPVAPAKTITPPETPGTPATVTPPETPAEKKN